MLQIDIIDTFPPIVADWNPHYCTIGGIAYKIDNIELVENSTVRIITLINMFSGCCSKTSVDIIEPLIKPCDAKQFNVRYVGCHRGKIAVEYPNGDRKTIAVNSKLYDKLTKQRSSILVVVEITRSDNGRTERYFKPVFQQPKSHQCVIS